MEILFDEYHSYYLNEAVKAKQQYLGGNLDFSNYFIWENGYYNQQKMKDYLLRSYNTLVSSISDNFFGVFIFTILETLAFCILASFAVGVLWKSKNLEINQRYYIRRVFLSISDFNCQQCCSYFKHVYLALLKEV